MKSCRTASFKSGSVPSWLRKLLPDECLPEQAWLDHVGTERVGNEKVFVSRPYGLGPSALEELYAFGKQHGLEIGVYPGGFLSQDAAMPTLEVRIFQPRAAKTARAKPLIEVSKKV